MPHASAKILVHLVFSTKNRIPILSDRAIRAELHAMIAYSFQQQGCPTLLVGGVADHVHALIVLSRTAPFSKVIGEAKRVSSVWIKTKGIDFAKFSWQGGYSAFSVSASLTQKVHSDIFVTRNIIIRNETIRMRSATCSRGMASNMTNDVCGTDVYQPLRGSVG